MKHLIEGRWYWIRITSCSFSSPGRFVDPCIYEWFPAKRVATSAGGWSNEDTWEDFDGDVEDVFGPIPVPPDSALSGELKLMKLEAQASAAGFWMRVHSPFFAGAPWSIGLCPHGTTGWNGRMDHSFKGPTFDTAADKTGAWLSAIDRPPTSCPCIRCCTCCCADVEGLNPDHCLNEGACQCRKTQPPTEKRDEEDEDAQPR